MDLAEAAEWHTQHILVDFGGQVANVNCGDFVQILIAVPLRFAAVAVGRHEASGTSCSPRVRKYPHTASRESFGSVAIGAGF